MSRLPEKILRSGANAATIGQLLMDPLETTQPGERNLMHWVLPPWQRPEVWDVARKRKFVEGIFLGLGTGIYVVHQPDWDAGGTKPMSGWLLDGQQRITAIRDFIQDDLAIFDGMKHSDLTTAERRSRWEHQSFPYVEIPYQRDESMLREIYHRLNFGAFVPHGQADAQRVVDTPFVSGMDRVEPGERDSQPRQRG